MILIQLISNTIIVWTKFSNKLFSAEHDVLKAVETAYNYISEHEILLHNFLKKKVY